MTFNHFVTYVVSAAAGVAALVYIGRQVGKLATLAKVLARLPTEHDQLLQVTKSNTKAIADLVDQVRQLTVDVAALVRR